MISGAHVIVYSAKPEADRAFLRDVLKLTHVNVGGGWLIFGLPPAEIAVHRSEKNEGQELWFMCDDLDEFMAEMERQEIVCDPVQTQDYGRLSQLTLPGGGKVGVYQPYHARPAQMA